MCRLILLSQLFEKRMLNDLRCGIAFVWVVDQHLGDDILGVGRHMWDKLIDAYELLRLEIKLHVRRMLLKVI